MSRVSKKVMVGDIAMGGGAPVSIQSMTNTDTRNVEATVEQAGISDKKLLKVRLVDYVPPKTVYEMLDEKNTKAVKRLIKKDSLCLVNFWCVDKTPSADGIVSPTQMLVRDKNGLTLEYEALGDRFGNDEGEILVQVWDLFGGRAAAKVKVKEI